MNSHQIEGLYFPFDDFFKDYSLNNSIYSFGQKSREAALKYVNRYNHVIDIGAHVGISVHHWQKMFEKVTAFEPMIDHFSCLEKNVKNLKNIELHNVAISSEEGKLYGSYRSTKNSGSFQLLDSDYQQPSKKSPRKLYEISVKKLDSFNFTDLNLLKIDVEGWEFEVLKGAIKTIQKHKPILLIEFTGGKSRKSLHRYNVNEYQKLILELDYKAVETIESDTIYVPK
jgi:FkbM family methyltransferase